MNKILCKVSTKYCEKKKCWFNVLVAMIVNFQIEKKNSLFHVIAFQTFLEN